jgi:hypothetical protein
MHTWAAGTTSSTVGKITHEAQILGDQGDPSELEEALGPERTAKARALKAGQQMKYRGEAWGRSRNFRFTATILIHRIY